MTTIAEIEKKIVKALETGQDPAPLLKEEAELQAQIGMDERREQLQKIADERQKLRDKAAKIKEKVKQQNEAIDAFLKARDSIVEALTLILERAKELPKLQENCYAGFSDIQNFAWNVRGTPADYLGSDFVGCPFLRMKDGTVSSDDMAARAFINLKWARGILADMEKGLPQLPLRKAEGLLVLEDDPEIEVGTCCVCSHADVETINGLLKNGKPLRDIESQFSVSRSSLSRHKKNCLNQAQ
ncbi:MAG: hypothetical protein ABR958_05075 [Dehalococcoidales bacterium]